MRRAKLYYLRKRSGKATRIKELAQEKVVAAVLADNQKSSASA